MFERFSDKARRVIFFARYEASQFGSPAIGTEHLLLGIVREAQKLLLSLSPSATGERIRERVGELVPLGAKIPTTVELPFSEPARRALNFALEEADRLGDQTISTRHLVMGLLREEDSPAQKILVELGVTLEAARQKSRAGDETAPETIHLHATGMPVPNRDFESVLNDAIEQARLLRSMSAKPEHLLLALLRTEGSAAEILREAGLDYASVRRKLEGDNANQGRPPGLPTS